MRKLAPILTLCLLLAGCGAERAEPPDLSQTETPAAFAPFSIPGGDVSFSYPVNWALQPKEPPGTATVASGGASVTVWAYQSVAGVTDRGSAELARKRLLASLRQRDPTFEVASSTVTTVAGSPAVEIRGTGQIAGREIEVRSVHVYKGRGEYVIDAFAEPEDFERADSEVFTELIAGLAVNGDPPAAVGEAPTVPTPPAPGG